MLHICVGLPAAPCIWQFQTKYMRSHLYENVSHKKQLVWQWNFPVGMFCLRRTDIQNGFWDFSSVRIGGLIQIFDADHSTLYADFVLGEIHIFPAQAAEFAYTDAGMHAKQQTE